MFGWLLVSATLVMRVSANVPFGSSVDIRLNLTFDPPCGQEHRNGVADGFTKRYGLRHLVHAEFHDDIRQAIQREKNIKHWPRVWKVNVIEENNPKWRDLYDQIQGN